MADLDSRRDTAQRVRPLDWVVVGAGVAMFAVSFLPWYSISVMLLGSEEIDAWHSGWPAILAVLLSMVASALWLVYRLSGADVPRAALIPLLAALAAAALIVLRWVTGPTVEGLMSAGPVGGLFAGLLIAIVQALAALFTLRPRR